MIVAVSKIKDSASKKSRYIDKVRALVLFDTDTKKLVTATTESIHKAVSNGGIQIDNICVDGDDLKETSVVANNARVFGNKSTRIIYKYYNIVVIATKKNIEVQELTEEDAIELEKAEMSYDIEVYGKVNFKKEDIHYIGLSPAIEEILETSLESVKTAEEAVVSVKELEDIGDPSCTICKGKGRYTAGIFGLLMTCECVTRKKEREEAERLKRERENLVYKVTGAQKIQIVAEKLVPEARKEDEFSDEIAKERVMNIYGSRNGSVRGRDFSEYVTLLNSIIADISIGEPLKMSYIIGAPNGFGKTTFANTCIKRLYAKGKKAVPYRSLLEIAALRDEYIKQMGKQYRKNTVKASDEDDYTYEEKTYTWDDYCKAEIVFCYLTTPENGWVEMSTLKALLTIRATNGLATIVMMDSSLQVYKANNEIRRYILDDILATSKEYGALDRLVHQSVYIIYRTGLDAIAGKDF